MAARIQYKSQAIANWKTKTDFTIDLTPAASSPLLGSGSGGGTYREHFKPRGGSEGSPVTYWTDPTDRAIISGGEIIGSSWTRCTQDDCPDNSDYDNIYHTDLNGEPDGIYKDGIELEVAASKDWGFWEVESAASNYELVDTSHLTGTDDYWVGAQVHYWPVAGSGRWVYAKILAYDAAAHKLSMEHAPFDHFGDYIEAGESYRLENHISLLSRPGDYVLDRAISPGKIRLYVWPYNSDDPAGHTYETKVRLTCISLNRVQNAVFHGFEVRFAARKCIYGIQVKNIEIENCFVHDNGTGIDISGSDVWVRKSVFTRQGTSINLKADNVLRTVTAVSAGESSVEFTPPTPNPLVTSISVVNWKNAASALKDFQLKITSPGYKAGEDGNDIGASINLQAWRNRDWDEDGLIDVSAAIVRTASLSVRV